MSSIRHRRSSSPRETYDPAHSADDPGARPAVRLLDLLLQVSLDAHHSALHFSVDDTDGGRVTAEAAGGPTVLLRAPAEALLAFVERLKLLADLDPAHTPPAEGLIQVSHGGAPVQLRVQTIVAVDGREQVRLAFDWPDRDQPGSPPE